MARLRLSLACGPYDRTQALRDGTIVPEGIELTYVAVQPAEIFWRMLQYQEFDVSEMSLSNYVTLVSKGNAPFIAIPVYPSRVFRHGYFFVNTEKGIERPSDLVGKRGGVPEYSQTAAVYMRGLLEHEYGVRPSQVEWVQGRADRLSHGLPPDVRVTPARPGAELSDLLERGEIDFLVTGNNPLSFRRGSPKVRRLFPSYRELEQDYYRRTKIYPIMHTVVIRRAVYERDPWVAQSLYQAFCAAKEQCYRLLLETGRVGNRWKRCCSTRTSRGSPSGGWRSKSCSRPARSRDQRLRPQRHQAPCRWLDAQIVSHMIPPERDHLCAGRSSMGQVIT
jgi:4,5-dihydroxyphthalate decarboxylase